MIPSKYSDASVLAQIASPTDLRAVWDLDNATNDRLLAQEGALPGIDRLELVTGVPYADIINAAFTHAHPLGTRFCGPSRGAWYAGFDLKTAQAEVVFHKSVQLAEINYFHDSVTYDVYLSDLLGDYHDLRVNPRAFAACLDPESYIESQKLGARLLRAGSLGIVYPSVRAARGTCAVCFRPAAVAHVRKGQTYRFVWSGNERPAIRLAR
jgi:hypothetical protein